MISNPAQLIIQLLSTFSCLDYALWTEEIDESSSCVEWKIVGAFGRGFSAV